MKPRNLLICLLLGNALVAGCAVNNANEPYYRSNQSQKSARVYYGQVISVNAVKTGNKEQDQWRSAAGSVLDNLNKGRNNANTGEVIGAVLGSLAGQALGQPETMREVEILVLMEGSNEVLKVVQQNDIAFKTGQRVRVVTGGGIQRVLPAQ